MAIFTMPLMERINNVFKRKEEVNAIHCNRSVLYYHRMPCGNQERPQGLRRTSSQRQEGGFTASFLFFIVM